MKNTIYAVVSIEYNQDDKGRWANLNEEDVEAIATDLAINPHFETKMCGISLKSVHVKNVDIPEYREALEYCPDQVYIK